VHLFGHVIEKPYLCNRNKNNSKQLKGTRIMNREQILDAVKTLAMSHGFYSRLYEKLTDGSEKSDKFLCLMEEQNFGDTVDMVLWLES
jgi:hypothetical protein